MKYLLIVFVFAVSVFAKGEGKALYHSCKFCHGLKAEKIYVNTIPAIKNMDYKILETKLKLYKKGELDIYGFGMIMKMQMKNMPDEKIPALVKYIKSL